jgi:hypothetical protein
MNMYLRICQPNSDAPQNFPTGYVCIIETRCVDKDYAALRGIVGTFTEDVLNIGCTRPQRMADLGHFFVGCTIDELSIDISL